jgi:hypothetical protein
MRLTRRGAPPADDPALFYGQYFKGITDVISKNGYESLVQAASRQVGRDIVLSDVAQILIYAEKHGSDYHPARVEVIVGRECAAFVMNVAVTARGTARLCREFETLQHLNSKYDFPFLPRTYFQGEAIVPPALMFLADWFEGYHEFHLSLDHKDGSQGLVLWDTAKGPRSLARLQVSQIYRQAAMILTLYYDVETFEQIFPWHHAAGDFVVKADKESVDVRLITARQYAPMVKDAGGISVREALLLFLLNLSVRMRVDRIDGVGSVAWADDECVDATLEGFVAGLRKKERQGVVEAGFVDGFLRYARSLGKEDLFSGFHAIVDACDQAAPDMPVIRAYLQGHISKFHSALQFLSGS